MSRPSIKLDAVVAGGGVAGLWILRRLRAEGYSCALLEANRLGTGQTISSQGIIHGGTKYALEARIGRAANAIAAMPGIWNNCLAGNGEIDLRAVRVLSSHQYLWSTASITSRLASFLAGKSMAGRVRRIEGSDRPIAFADPRYTGPLYRLEEPVLDCRTVLTALAETLNDHLLKIDWPNGIELGLAGESQHPVRIALRSPARRELELRARVLIGAAGPGNDALLERLGMAAIATQRRALHMVMMRWHRGELPMVYGHCIGASTIPLLTVTTHEMTGGDIVWYIGGEPAESGTDLGPVDQIARTRKRLARLMPWISTAGVSWATLRIDRAELAQPRGRRPDGPGLEIRGPVIMAWPTKLALAPRLADEVIKSLREAGIDPAGSAPRLPSDWPAPDVAQPPWEETRSWIDDRSVAPA